MKGEETPNLEIIFGVGNCAAGRSELASSSMEQKQHGDWKSKLRVWLSAVESRQVNSL